MVFTELDVICILKKKTRFSYFAIREKYIIMDLRKYDKEEIKLKELLRNSMVAN